MPYRIVGVPDYGGELFVSDSEIVPMGDVFAYREITYSFAGSDRLPALDVVFQVRNAVPVCVKYSLTASAAGSPVRTKDLTAKSVDQMMHDLYAHIGVFRLSDDGSEYIRVLHFGSKSTSTFNQDRRTVEKAAIRRKLGDGFFEQVAEIHRNAGEGRQLKDIEDAFGVSYRTAIRYRDEARRKGLI